MVYNNKKHKSKVIKQFLKSNEIIKRIQIIANINKKQYSHTVLIIALLSTIVAIKVVVVAGITGVATIIESAVREGLLIIPERL